MDRVRRFLTYDSPASFLVITTIAGDLLQPFNLFVPAQFSGVPAVRDRLLRPRDHRRGARDVAGISMEIARIFVIVFLVLAVLSLIP